MLSPAAPALRWPQPGPSALTQRTHDTPSSPYTCAAKGAWFVGCDWEGGGKKMKITINALKYDGGVYSLIPLACSLLESNNELLVCT